MSKVRTSSEKISAVVELYKAGIKNEQISAQTGVKVRTVRNLIARFKEGGGRSLPVHRHGGGKPRKISPITQRSLQRQVRRNPTLTARALKEQNQQTLGEVSIRTIQETLHDAGYRKVAARRKPAITPSQRKKRIAFAKKYSEWDLAKWRSVLWTDEATFFVSDPKGKRVWKAPGADPLDPNLLATSVKHPSFVMVWGGFGYHGVTPLIVLPPKETVTKEKYYLLLNERLEECFEKTQTSIFQQDGAPAHTAKLVKGWLEDCGIEYIPDWPGNSPDISPVENLWAILKQKVKDADTSSIEKLTAALHSAWDQISSDTLNHLADSVPNRLKEVKKRKGNPIKY